MINQQLLDFIKQQLSKGLTKDVVSKQLLDNGWTEQDIKEGFESLPMPTSSIPTPSSIFVPPTQTNPLNNDQIKLLKAKHFRSISFFLGLFSPCAILLLYGLFILAMMSVGGFGALGLAVMFSLCLPVLSFIISIPLGIFSIIFGIKAFNIIKNYDVKKKSYILAIFTGFLSIAIPIILFFLLIFPSRQQLCIFNHYPGTGGCLSLPLVPSSLQQDDSNNPNVPFTEYGAEQVAKNMLNHDGDNYNITKVAENSAGWIFDYNSKANPSVVDVWNSKYGASGEGPIFVDKNSQKAIFVNSNSINEISAPTINLDSRVPEIKEGITILVPSHDDTLTAGTTQEITWTQGPLICSSNKVCTPRLYDISLMGVETQKYQSIIKGVGTYSYNWNIPNSLVGNDYVIQVCQESSTICGLSNVGYRIFSKNNNNKQNTTVSSSTNNASTVTILIPHGGENWTQASTHIISWKDTASTASQKYDITFIQLAGQWIPAQTSTTVTTGVSGSSYSWKVPSSLVLGSYKAEVQVCETGKTVCGVSNPFNIVSGVPVTSQ
jgi:hypothetical protein